jgi:hypothetical protein
VEAERFASALEVQAVTLPSGFTVLRSAGQHCLFVLHPLEELNVGRSLELAEVAMDELGGMQNVRPMAITTLDLQRRPTWAYRYLQSS